MVPSILPPERSTSAYSPKECSPPTLFRFVAHFACVRIEDSGNRFASTAYFAKPCFVYPWGEISGRELTVGEVTGGELSGRKLSMGGSARGGKRRGKLPGGEESGHRVRHF